MKNPLHTLHTLWAALSSLSSLGASASLRPEDIATIDIPAAWLEPIAADQPSGPTLEYDPEYAVLAARLTPKVDVQYGAFKADALAPDFKEVERDCRRLLLRSKDLTLLLWFTRSRTRQAGAQGLLQGLAALQQVCEHFGDSVHPQLHIDGQPDPLVRANALAALCDPEGLLDDVREVLIVSASAQRLSVRDVERALAVPRSAYAMEPEALQRQLTDLAQRGDPQLMALRASAACVQWLAQWAQAHLGDEAPNLQPLQKLLQPLCGKAEPSPGPAIKLQAEAVEAAPAPGLAPAPTMAIPADALPVALWPGHAPQGSGMYGAAPNIEHSREHIRHTLAQVRAWIEHHEPSSPAAIVIKRAERLWGKRFTEAMHLISPELLQQWDQEHQQQDAQAPSASGPGAQP